MPSWSVHVCNFHLCRCSPLPSDGVYIPSVPPSPFLSPSLFPLSTDLTCICSHLHSRSIFRCTLHAAHCALLTARYLALSLLSLLSPLSLAVPPFLSPLPLLPFLLARAPAADDFAPRPTNIAPGLGPAVARRVWRRPSRYVPLRPSRSAPRPEIAMFSVHCFIVAAALAAVVAILQLPTLLLGHLEDFGNVLLSLVSVAAVCFCLSAWVRPPPGLLTVAAYLVSSATCGPMLVVYCVARNVGIFAEFVDNLLRDEELRSALEPEYAKLRAEYRKQVAAIGALNDKALEVCKDHNRRCTELPPRYAFRRRPYVKPAGYRDTEWREPHTLAKMCKSSLSCRSGPSPFVFSESCWCRRCGREPQSKPISRPSFVYPSPFHGNRLTQPRSCNSLRHRSQGCLSVRQGQAAPLSCSRQQRPHPPSREDGRDGTLGAPQPHRQDRRVQAGACPR